MCQIMNEKLSRKDRGWAFVTNMATVLHDHRYSVTAGFFWTDSLILELHWPTKSSILGADPPIVPVAAWGKGFEAVGAVPSKLCHVVLGSVVLIGRPGTRVTPIPEGYPPWLAKSATLDSPFARSQFFYSPSRITSAAWTSCRDSGALPVTLCGSGVANVRSDKDSEPETYGEGIKKEIRYRRPPYL